MCISDRGDSILNTNKLILLAERIVHIKELGNSERLSQNASFIDKELSLLIDPESNGINHTYEQRENKVHNDMLCDSVSQMSDADRMDNFSFKLKNDIARSPSILSQALSETNSFSVILGNEPEAFAEVQDEENKLIENEKQAEMNIIENENEIYIPDEPTNDTLYINNSPGYCNFTPNHRMTNDLQIAFRQFLKSDYDSCINLCTHLLLTKDINKDNNEPPPDARNENLIHILLGCCHMVRNERDRALYEFSLAAMKSENEAKLCIQGFLRLLREVNNLEQANAANTNDTIEFGNRFHKRNQITA
ncbi:hypothetical protein GJ496_008666 [Pomphorhynchus laevis]|nr:hypothetical protein GJ496_008666 [Pomphorhynchus laevis]